MKVLSLSCDSCGAKLDVPSKANFVTCAFCQTRLKIQRGETAVITEALEELSSEIHSLKKDASVARLDREWMASRERFQSRRRGETQTLPSTAGGVVAIIIGIAWAAFLTGGLSQTPFGSMAMDAPSGWHSVESDAPSGWDFVKSGAPSGWDFVESGESFGSQGRGASFSIFAMLGMLGGIASVGAGIWQIFRASAYKAELARYREHRRELMGD